MRAEHLEILVEEPSMEAFLAAVLPRWLRSRATFQIHVHQGKPELLRALENRLRGYSHWLPATWRIVVLVDRDSEDCMLLKQRMETAGEASTLRTRSAPNQVTWQVVNRIVIEELEAWFFGEWEAVRAAFPRVPVAIPRRASYRNPDAIAGGTWEALERIFKRAGYFTGGLRKVEAAQAVGQYFNPMIVNSPSFTKFRDAIEEAVEDQLFVAP